MAEGDGPTIQSGQTGDGQDNAQPQKGAEAPVSPSVQRESAGVPVRAKEAVGVNLPEAAVTKGAKTDVTTARTDRVTESSKLTGVTPKEMQLAKQMEATRLELGKMQEELFKAREALMKVAEKVVGRDLKGSNPADVIAEIVQKVQSGNVSQGMISAAREVSSLVTQYAPMAQKHIETMSGLLATAGDAKSTAEAAQPQKELARLQKAVSGRGSMGSV